MSAEKPNPADDGMRGLAPHLVCKGAADAMDWCKKGLGAEELMRLPGPDGRLMHGSMKINGCMVMFADEFGDAGPEHSTASPLSLGGTSVAIHMVVDDCDGWIARAQAAGAKVIMPATDQFWGDRYGQVEDPWGHRWSMATPKTSVTGEELVDAMNKAMGT
jgi:PhnB protein